MEYSLYPMGDQGITINFGNEISEQIHQKVKAAFQFLKQEVDNVRMEIVPTYNTITIYYRLGISYQEMEQWINTNLANFSKMNLSDKYSVIEIPVCYESQFGPDLTRVAAHNQLSEEDVIQKHSSSYYLIYMMGFLPGFPYLGGLPNELETPRLHSPRPVVEAGSVGIAGKQTGIYSITSPGGWNIIGKTPIKIFHPQREQPFLLEMGAYIKFTAITSDEFNRLDKLGI